MKPTSTISFQIGLEISTIEHWKVCLLSILVLTLQELKFGL